ncbi:ras GTPAse, putative [Plasmodium ovale curtisi]|uniref:Ras GTPAse, putative n=1 Tax=Plasmodium ovale curtisi TaxID=864141 RepID=A0A1A8W156_PLAOA|nr:ras GTPAse, putative [Plasmodium ovale curtisi]
MESLRILVLGDLGVGKSSFLRLISERFYEIYPINYFDYFVCLERKEGRAKEGERQLVSAKDLAQNNCTKQSVEAIVESMFFQAKKNFLSFIESKMNTKSLFCEERHKYTYGLEIFPFLWDRNSTYNKNMFEKNIPINMLKRGNMHTCEGSILLNHNEKDVDGGIGEDAGRFIGNDGTYVDGGNYLLVEFFEIGGVQTYSYIRNIFYEKHDGILLVYDSSNNKSYHNLVNWLYELYINAKPPSDVFCKVFKQQNSFWNIFQSKKNKGTASSLGKKGGRHGFCVGSDHKDRYNGYSRHDRHKCRRKKCSDSDESDCSSGTAYSGNSDVHGDFSPSDGSSDIEKGTGTGTKNRARTRMKTGKTNEEILRGEIPIACVATKIDKKTAKQKPVYVETPKKSYLYNLFFSDLFANISSYENKNNLKIKKDILKKLEYLISQAIEIKASSIDCIVDIEKFLTFLRRTYDKKHGQTTCPSCHHTDVTA